MNDNLKDTDISKNNYVISSLTIANASIIVKPVDYLYYLNIKFEGK